MTRFVYIASAYTAKTPDEVEANVQRAIDAFAELADAGLQPFLPHLYHYVHLRHPRPYQHWMDLDLAWLGKCDALLRLVGPSPGAGIEVRHATDALGIPVFHDVPSVIAWAQGRARP